jgi:signal peptidase I
VTDTGADEPQSSDSRHDGDDGIARRAEREGATATADDAEAGAQVNVPPPPPPPPAKAKAKPKTKSSTRNMIEWAVVILGAVLIAVVVRTFVLQTFWIPSPSMSPTLIKDDRVLVNKLSYKFHDVNRGDVVVFERPPNEPPSNIKDLIKRVIGVPGDRVSVLDGKVRINGEVLDEPYVNGLQTTLDSCPITYVPGIDTEAGFEVPDDELLVMGDNRVNSHDGRCFGPIDEDLVVGRAFFLMWPPGRAGGL